MFSWYVAVTVPLPVPLDGEMVTQLQLSLADQMEAPFDVTEMLAAPEADVTVFPVGTVTVHGAPAWLSVYVSVELPHENVIVQDLGLTEEFS